jgi:hypothetical protein
MHLLSLGRFRDGRRNRRFETNDINLKGGKPSGVCGILPNECRIEAISLVKSASWISKLRKQMDDGGRTFVGMSPSPVRGGASRWKTTTATG